MEYFTLARVLHVLAVILWIGGVAMVTTVIIPAVKKLKSKEDQIKTFEQIEGKFALQAKITTLITGITGFYMLYVLDAWDRYFDYRFWWIHAMTLVWIIFSLILYVLEPLVLHKLFKKYAEDNPAKTFRFMHRMHWILLVLSLITTAGAVAGSHGWFFFK
ncbi:membrane protein [Aquimarina atlantica]|uniref:Membrane protein n=1 Tax=Aquimarina atlantica TaxID=1317122 RepID=A0A023BV64_9FLAO|nr:membrane protein [Aquimarina atlantica]EZH73891.1 membrane protein [Aquimarina atlantica]